MDRIIIDQIKATGFRVYMRNAKDIYCYFTDGKNIGYFQIERIGSFSISTVHIPNTTSGTGYQIERYAYGAITKDRLRAAFITCPSWAGRDSSVRKWNDFEAFRNADSFNKQLTET